MSRDLPEDSPESVPAPRREEEVRAVGAPAGDIIRMSDVTMEFFVAGGPGGQHRNRTESGVRLTHLPTGIVVTATERRSQSENRKVAFERLAERLASLQRVRKPRRPTRPGAAAKARRRQEKAVRSEQKQARRRTSRDED